MPHGGSTGTAPWTPCPDTNRIVHDSTWTSKLHWSKARARVFPPTKLLHCGRPTLVNGNSSLSPSSPLHRQGRQGWQQQPFETAVKWSHSFPFKTLPWILISLREVKLQTMVSKAPNQESANVGGPLPVSINKVLLAHRQLASVLAMAASGLRATRPKTLTPGPSRSQPAHPDSQRSASHPRPSAGISFHSLPHSLCTSPRDFLAVSRVPGKLAPWGPADVALCGRQLQGLLIQLGQDLPEPNFTANGNPPQPQKNPTYPHLPSTNYLSPYH